MLVQHSRQTGLLIQGTIHKTSAYPSIEKLHLKYCNYWQEVTMPQTNSLLDISKSTHKLIDGVIEILQSRKDYSTKQKVYGSITSIKDIMPSLISYKNVLLACTTTDKLPDTALHNALSASDHIIKLVNDLINGNIAVSNMGQLCLDHAIDPGIARNHNVKLNSLMNSVCHFVQQVKVALNEDNLPPPAPAGSIATQLTLSNGLPAAITCLTTVNTPSDWVSPTHRPDEVLNEPSGKARSLDSFSEVTGQVYIRESASVAIFKIEVSMTEKDKKEIVTFECDMACLVKQPDGNEVSVIKPTASSDNSYYLYQLITNNTNGTPELALSLSDKGGINSDAKLDD